ncbi:MAG TPA: energy transducer TonB [Terriglobia bacterium]|nr:energy transducer TonB [Terriglobia bacterium]
MKASLTIAALLFVSLLIVSAQLCAQTTGAPEGPLTKSQVDDLVASGVDSQRIAAVVKERGINFQPTNDYLDSLGSKGAKQELLDALSAAVPTPLSKSELLRLLATGKSSDDLVPIVQRRGIDFKPTAEDLDTLRIAGARDRLLKTIQEAKLRPPHLNLPPMELANFEHRQAHASASTRPATGGVYSIGGNVSAPVPIYQPDPPYSDEARRARRQGTVVLSIVADEHGGVGDVQVLTPLGLGLDENAVDTVKTWKFRPALRNGAPVSVRMLVEVTFRMDGSNPVPPSCTLPATVAQIDWDDFQKVQWGAFAEDSMYWWSREGGTRKFPRVCLVSRDAAKYLIAWRKTDYPYPTSLVEVYALSRSQIVYPVLYISKNRTSDKGAFKDALKYLTHHAAKP